MCDKCQPKRTYWLHIADIWTLSEMLEMRDYLKKKLAEKEAKAKEAYERMSTEERTKMMRDIIEHQTIPLSLGENNEH